MAEQQNALGAPGSVETSHSHPGAGSSAGDGGSGTAVQTPPTVRQSPRKAPPRLDHLPQWKVLLHNDDYNEIGYVVDTIVELLAINPLHALIQTLEAHKSGLALLTTTHRERAELISEQFASKRLTVTIEPDC